jgi:outer membrane protein TolC
MTDVNYQNRNLHIEHQATTSLDTRSALHRPRVGALARTSALVASAMLSACAVIPDSPAPKALDEFSQQNLKDREAIQKNVPILQAPLTVEAALARALKYNLDLRARQMEELLASGSYRASLLDMLPSLTARESKTERDKDRQTAVNGVPNALTQDRSSTQRDLGVSWNLLDSAVAYFNARQNEGRARIAEQKRRKTIHLLTQDVRNAFWRAAAAQSMRSKLRSTIADAEMAIAASRQLELERLRPPQESMAYQRQLSESIRLLEGIEQELAPAEVELAALVNLPLHQPIVLKYDWSQSVMLDGMDETDRLEEMALAHNGDLHDVYIQSQIAREETRKVMTRLFPSLNFSVNSRYDSDRYLVNHNWIETSSSLSFNLLNLLTVPVQTKLAEAGVQLADQRRMVTQMAVLTQLHVARLGLKNAATGLARAQQMWDIDQRLLKQSQALQTALLRGRLETISTQSNALLSEFRRYQALAQVQVAESRMRAALGQEMDVGPLSQPLEELTERIRQQHQRPSWSTASPKAHAPAEKKEQP